MSDFAPEIIPLGSLQQAADASVQLSLDEQQGQALGVPILTGRMEP